MAEIQNDAGSVLAIVHQSAHSLSEDVCLPRVGFQEQFWILHAGGTAAPQYPLGSHISACQDVLAEIGRVSLQNRRQVLLSQKCIGRQEHRQWKEKMFHR